MALNQVRISFYVDVEAESYEEVEVAVGGGDVGVEGIARM
jgi:hypothetical protein